MNRTLLYLCCASALVCSCRIRTEQVKEPSPVRVTVMTVKAGGESEGDKYVGHVAPDRSVTLKAPCSGTLESLRVRKGQSVSRGQIVAVMRSQQVESALGTARANLRQAQDAYDRVLKVYSEGGVSQLQMVDIETKLSKAKEAESAARKALEDCSIRAPYAGTVSGTEADEGVELAPGAAIVSIIDISEMKLLVSVHENEINLMTAGLHAKVEIPALGLFGLDASLTEKNMLSSTLSHSYECAFKLDRPVSGLMPGMAVKVRTDSRKDENIIIPAAAVQLDSRGKYVWTCDDGGIVRKVRIRVGGYSGKGVIVSIGLKDGDKVITEGYQKISTGMKVEAR